MKKNVLSLALALALSLGMFTMGALAASGTRTLEVTYKDIKLVIDGQEIVPKDAAGNVVEPFQANGTTYLPVRAIGEALGKEVTWDGSTNTVYVGVSATQALPYQVNWGTLYDGSDPNNSFSVAGQAYTKGVVLRSAQNVSGTQKGVADGSAIWNTEGFQNMTFTIGHVGSRQLNATLYVSLDGVAAGEYELKWDGSPQTITVSLGSSPNVKLTLVSEGSNPNYWSTDAGSNIKSHGIEYGIYNATLS